MRSARAVIGSTRSSPRHGHSARRAESADDDHAGHRLGADCAVIGSAPTGRSSARARRRLRGHRLGADRAVIGSGSAPTAWSSARATGAHPLDLVMADAAGWAAENADAARAGGVRACIRRSWVG
jgi:hypothetical protein